MVEVSTPSRRLTLPTCARFLSMRFCSGAVSPVKGMASEATRVLADGDPEELATHAADEGATGKALLPGLQGSLQALPKLRRVPTQRAVFPRDTGLQLRMGLTLFLLGLLYVGWWSACWPPARARR